MFSIFRFIFGMLGSSAQRHKRRLPEPVNSNDVGTVKKKQALSTTEMAALLERLPEGRVLHILDGDSLIVAMPKTEVTIRLDSIDCPEDGQPWGDIAAAGLTKLVGRKIIAIEEHGPDSYGRMLATIYVRHRDTNKWLNVNERMVTLGHAWVMRTYYDHLPKDRQASLTRLEAWAKSKKVGLWRTENPIPPWQWRKKRNS